MPKVFVEYRRELEPWLPLLAQLLPTAVAEALSVPATEAELRPSEVEVRFQEIGPNDVTQGYDVMVIVFANEYPEREEILDEASAALAARVVGCIHTPVGDTPVKRTKGHVWITLVKGAFTEW
ncbi:hypothetical protein HYV98_00040 [Candidatus Azambacteria bacterium]|nr:hypothetical protein [Candidatus Azambacteria bacterium]